MLKLWVYPPLRYLVVPMIRQRGRCRTTLASNACEGTALEKLFLKVTSICGMLMPRAELHELAF